MNKTQIKQVTSKCVDSCAYWIKLGKPSQYAKCGSMLAMQKALSELSDYCKDNVLAANEFWRGTNNKAEINLVGIVSKNHITGGNELGLSVSKSLATVHCYNYQYVYKVIGDIAGAGSDGEYCLINYKAVSKIKKSDVVLKKDTAKLNLIKCLQSISAATGMTVSDLAKYTFA